MKEDYLKLKNSKQFPYPDYDTFDKRKSKYYELMNNKINYSGKIFMIGFGAIGNCLLYLLLKLINIDPKAITVIEMKKSDTNIARFPGVKFMFETRLTKENYKSLLKDVAKNDIIIDCAYDIGTNDLMRFCNEREASHINSCIQEWDSDESDGLPGLYGLHKKLEKINDEIKKQGNFNSNFIISMGCNPGNVSLWVRQGIIEIAKRHNIVINNNDLNLVSQKLGIQTIHISEKDTQIVDKPKKTNEYCNTWSKTIEPYYGEALSHSELSWGTHELPVKEIFNENDIALYEENFLVLNKIGTYTYAQSWLPFCDKYIGTVICHDESYTISNNLTVKNALGNIVYKPSVYYVYKPCNEAVNSIYELKERNEIYQDNYRLLTDEIISGRDILGLTYFLGGGKIYWIGSTLDIIESRKLFNDEINDIMNATVLQVIVGYLTGIIYMIDLNNKNEKLGLIVPDQIPLKYIKYQLPFLGDLIFVSKDDYKISILDNNLTDDVFETGEFKFNNFLI